jgi:hypothetical protein
VSSGLKIEACGYSRSFSTAMQRLHGRIFMLEAGGSDGVKHCVWLEIALGDRGRILGNSRGS